MDFLKANGSELLFKTGEHFYISAMALVLGVLIAVKCFVIVRPVAEDEVPTIAGCFSAIRILAARGRPHILEGGHSWIHGGEAAVRHGDLCQQARFGLRIGDVEDHVG